jgi:hypothetical protein
MLINCSSLNAGTPIRDMNSTDDRPERQHPMQSDTAAPRLPLYGRRDATGLPLDALPTAGTKHAVVTGIIQAVSWLMLLGGLIGVLVLATNGNDDSYLYATDPTLSPAMAWAAAAVIILQFALLQAVALGLDYLAAMKQALVPQEAAA